jgi:hypothetical protein
MQPAAMAAPEHDDEQSLAQPLRRATQADEPLEARRAVGTADERKDESVITHAFGGKDTESQEATASLRRIESRPEIRDEPPNEAKARTPEPISRPEEEPGHSAFRNATPSMNEEERPLPQRMPAGQLAAAHSPFLPPISSVPEEEERKRESSVLQTLRFPDAAAAPRHAPDPATAAGGGDLPTSPIGPAFAEASELTTAIVPTPGPVTELFHGSDTDRFGSQPRANVLIDQIDVLIHEAATPARDVSGPAAQRSLRARYLGGL